MENVTVPVLFKVMLNSKVQLPFTFVHEDKADARPLAKLTLLNVVLRLFGLKIFTRLRRVAELASERFPSKLPLVTFTPMKAELIVEF